MDMIQADEPVYQQEQSNYHTTLLNQPPTTQRQQLYPCTLETPPPGPQKFGALEEADAILDSPIKQPFGMRPPSHQGQGMRSAVVSATTGRMALDRLSTNIPMNTGNVGYRTGSTKGVVAGAGKTMGYLRK